MKNLEEFKKALLVLASHGYSFNVDTEHGLAYVSKSPTGAKTKLTEDQVIILAEGLAEGNPATETQAALWTIIALRDQSLTLCHDAASLIETLLNRLAYVVRDMDVEA